ncbi:hypothetical protein CCACVL1_27413 [Corchorus capsularis]|uniref:Transposase-associated domain-containing protein n=1 Tax=Corchorus capsularis TaxID=210143 RepID=A0A1R3GAG3_COCAP|nr:hypothetical protein CCACVL1_27413 [Corchorus capsularis]
MDKTWIGLTSRASLEYREGVNQFLDFAFARSSSNGKIWCPCVKCVNTYRVSRSEAYGHLICDGFLKGYDRWVSHGEVFEEESTSTVMPNEEGELGHQINDLLHDIMGEGDMDVDSDNTQFGDVVRENELVWSLFLLILYLVLQAQENEYIRRNRTTVSESEQPIGQPSGQQFGQPSGQHSGQQSGQNSGQRSGQQSVAAEDESRQQHSTQQELTQQSREPTNSATHTEPQNEQLEGRIRCSGLKSTSSNRSCPSCSQLMQPNEEVQGLRSEIATLRTALNGVLGVLRRQFPNESEELLNTIARVVDGEVADAGSAPEISPHRNNRSSESTHQPSPINDDSEFEVG